MAIIDDMTVLAGAGGTATRQGHERRAADEELEAIVKEPDPQPVPDEPRGHRVEHLPQREAARRGDGDERLLMIAAPPAGQPLQCGPLGLDAFGVAGILAAHDLVDEAAIGCEIVEVADAAHQQRVLDRFLEMAVRGLDRAVLMSEAPIVAGRLHPVIGAQRIVAPGQILARVRGKVAERGREAVAAMLARRAAEGP